MVLRSLPQFILSLLFLPLLSVLPAQADTALPIQLISSNFFGQYSSPKFGRKVEFVIENNRALMQFMPGAKRVNFNKQRIIAVRIPDALLKSDTIRRQITVNSANATPRYTMVDYTIYDVSPCSVGVPEYSTFMVVSVPKVGRTVKFSRHRSANADSCVG